MSKYKVTFDDLWTLKNNHKGMKRRLEEIRKRTKSIHIQEILIDQELMRIIEKNLRICEKYLPNPSSTTQEELQ